MKRGLMMMMMIREARIFIDGFGKEEEEKEPLISGGENSGKV